MKKFLLLTSFILLSIISFSQLNLNASKLTSGPWIDSLRDFKYDMLHSDSTKFFITDDSIKTNTGLLFKVVKNYNIIKTDSSTIIPVECLNEKNQRYLISIVIDKGGIAIVIVGNRYSSIYVVHLEKYIIKYNSL
jgi:hypothetical protein